LRKNGDGGATRELWEDFAEGLDARVLALGVAAALEVAEGEADNAIDGDGLGEGGGEVVSEGYAGDAGGPVCARGAILCEDVDVAASAGEEAGVIDADGGPECVEFVVVVGFLVVLPL
jgi:hypothetical protein